MRRNVLIYTYSKLMTSWEDIQTKSTKDFTIKETTLVKYNGADVAEITVPEGITEIGKNAFEDCDKLERVILPDSLKVIGYGAFLGAGLISVDIPDGVEKLDALAFSCCHKLKNVKFGKGLKTIGAGAFDFSDLLQSVILPEGLTFIDRKAFYECTSLTSVSLPQSLEKISEQTFGCCCKLDSVVLPSGLREIGSCAFRATRLSRLTVPASVQSIGSGAFASCDISAFKTEEGSPFTVVDGCLIDVANKKLIAGCPKSKIPEDGSVTSIASKAFSGYDFKDDEHITIPLAVTVIEEHAFSDCENLKIFCKEDEYDTYGFDEQWYEHPEAWEENEWADEEIPVVKWGCMSNDERAEKDRKIREEEDAAERFRLSQLNDYVRVNGVMTKYVGLGSEIVIPTDVRIIRAHCFDDCNNIESIKIHHLVSAVEIGAFDKFKDTDVQFYFQAEHSPRGFNNYRFKKENLHFGGLTEEERRQTEEDNVRSKLEELALRGFEVQGEYLRKYNGNDEYVVLPYNDVRTVDKEAFKANTKIKTVHFGSVDSFWDDAFEGCINLEKVILPDTVTKFSSGVFCNCEKLNIERFPVLTNEVYACAFMNTALETVALNVKFVGNNAFSDCRKLTKVNIYSDERCDVRWRAFSNCPSLKEAEFNFQSKSVEWGMFDGCNSLAKIKFPRGLEVIGAKAFKDCSLYDVEFPATLREIGDQAFLNCGSMRELTIPYSVSKIGNGAFMGCSFTKITLPSRFKDDMERIFGRKEPDPFGFDVREPKVEIVFESR